MNILKIKHFIAGKIADSKIVKWAHKIQRQELLNIFLRDSTLLRSRFESEFASLGFVIEPNEPLPHDVKLSYFEFDHADDVKNKDEILRKADIKQLIIEISTKDFDALMKRGEIKLTRRELGYVENKLIWERISLRNKNDDLFESVYGVPITIID